MNNNAVGEARNPSNLKCIIYSVNKSQQRIIYLVLIQT